MPLYVDNDHLLWVRRLYDRYTAAYVNDATVTVQVKDGAGTDVGSPVVGTYVAASNGDYVAQLQDTLALVAGRDYSIVVTVEASSGRKRTFTLRERALESTG